MSFLATVYQVLIASPSDVSEQRKKIPEVIHKWNTEQTAYYNIAFLPVKWETHVIPEMGDRPQAIINKQIVENSDILVGTFWTKLGSHTGVAESGTVEEIQEFMKNGKKVMLYFSSAPVVLESVNLEQYQKLAAFKKECQQKGVYDSYSTIEEFERKLYSHLTAFAQNIVHPKKELNNNEIENKLLIQYYLPNHSSFSSTFKAFKRDDLINSKLIKDIKDELNKLIHEISDIKLPSFSEISKEKINIGRDDTKLPKLNLSVKSGSPMVSKELSNQKQTEIIKKTNRLLGVDLESSFFHVGELMESMVTFSHPLFKTSKKIEGSTAEIEKDEKINNFIYKLNELEDYLDIFEYIGNYYIAPLILQNIGKVFNESITVKLKFPKNVEILKANDIKIPSPNIVENFTDGIFNFILRQNKDSLVQENFNYIPLPSYGGVLDIYQEYTEKVNKLNTNYKYYIESLFNVEIYIESDYTVLEFYFKELNPKENIAFPSFILFKSTETFKILYEITSKNLPDRVEGILEYQI